MQLPPDDGQPTARRLPHALQSIAILVGSMWGVFFLDSLLSVEFARWGIEPRRLSGLVGIPLAPFLHGGLGHLLSNTIPMIVLLILLKSSRTRTWDTLAELTLLGGFLLWCFGIGGREHIGASILIYSLITFLITVGFREKHPISLVIALLVGFLYGGTLISGVLPIVTPSGVSWEGHLYGGIAGILTGVIHTPTSQTTSAR